MPLGYCTSFAIITKAGANASSVAIASGSIINQAGTEADAWINVMTRHDWGSSPPTAVYLPVLADISSSIAGIKIICYDMESIGKSEAINRINVLWDSVTRGIEMLKDYKTKETLGVN